MQNHIVWKEAVFLEKNRHQLLQQECCWISNKWGKIDNNKWTAYRMEELITLISKWSVNQLMLSGNGNPDIPKSIMEVEFPSLLILAFASNTIPSIECLNRIRMPNLTTLYLNNNRIKSFRCIRKCNIPQIQMLVLTDNFGRDLELLPQMDGRMLNALLLEWDKGGQQSPSTKWTVKLSSQNLNLLELRSRKRIQRRPDSYNWLIKKYTILRISLTQ